MVRGVCFWKRVFRWWLIPNWSFMNDQFGMKQPFHQGLGEIAFIADQFSHQTLYELGERLAIIDVASRELPGPQFTVMIDDEMQFGAVEPARGISPA
jgi:hypothetical protein